MDEIEKRLQKVTTKEKITLLAIIDKLLENNLSGLDIKKLKGTDFYRARCGRYRIIFHKEKDTKEIIVDAIKLRNENTYK